MRRMSLCIVIIVAAIGIGAVIPAHAEDWTVAEQNVLRSLWIVSLPPLPTDISNKVADNSKAAKLGHRIFFDPRFSANGNVSCAKCHQPDRAFTDGLVDAQGITKTQGHTPTIIGAAYSPWFFRDGRSDSMWAQALGPLENPVEHGSTRTHYAKVLYADPTYRAAYEDLFKPLPDLSDDARFPALANPNGASTGYAKAADAKAPNGKLPPHLIWSKMKFEDRLTVTRIFSNIGKVVAAYERLLLPWASKFDKYVEAVLNKDKDSQESLFDEEEVAGLRIFIGKGNCLQCHNGPLFTNNAFHNTGVKSRYGAQTNKGRADGVISVLSDPFNCFGAFSDAIFEDCSEIRFAKVDTPELIASFKTPTLRNIAKTAPYMHDGQMESLERVVSFYSHAPHAPIGRTELRPLHLPRYERRQLIRFLETLDSPVNTPGKYLVAPDS